MNLQGRNLSENMQGNDVALLLGDLERLGFAILHRERQSHLFGASIKGAVQEFQRSHQLTATGIVDEITAARLSAEVAARSDEPQRFVVRGRISQNGRSLSSMVVRASDKDLRREQALGENTTTEQGLYEIAYTPQQFLRAEKRHADLSVRVFDSAGTERGASETYFNAPAIVIVDIAVMPREAALAESQHLVQIYRPLLDGMPLEELTEEDITFLISDTKQERQHLEFLHQSALYARDTGIAMETFYGLARQGLAGQNSPNAGLDRLLAHPLATLRRNLELAMQERIIPALSAESLDATMQALDHLRDQTTVPARHELFARLLDQETRAPLAGYIVRASALNSGAEPEDLGSDSTNSTGLFAIVYNAPRPISGREPAGGSTQTLQLHILTLRNEEIHQVDITVSTTQEQVLDILIPLAPANVVSPSIEEINQLLELQTPSELLAALQTQGIRTLADIRRKGGLQRVEELPVPLDHPAVLALEAHARLSLLSPEVESNAALIAKGFTDLVKIASASRAHFVSAMHEVSGDFKAAELHVRAKAMKHFYDSTVMAMQASGASGFGQTHPDVQSLDPALAVQCDCCGSALSPLAYLADLLEYTVTHMLDNGQLISLTFLENQFHQRFSQLPASCAEMDKRIRQVRLCVEVLRSYLANSSQPSGLKKKEQEYRLAAYTTLLARIGTSYEEIGTVRIAAGNERTTLAVRLGISLLASRPDQLDMLYLDPEATPEALTEKALEELFGLVETTRNPLIAGKIPLVQTWRLEHLRTLWKAEDWPDDLITDGKPIVDPDVISPDDLRDPVAGQPAFDLWQSRRAFVDALLADLQTTREATGLDQILGQVLGQPLPDLTTLQANLTQGVDVATTIQFIQDNLHLSLESFQRLMTIRAKDGDPVVANQPTASEWAEVYAILTQAEKVKQFAAWHTEEQQADVFLGPKQFWIALQEPQLQPWLASEEDRRAWVEALRIRSSAPHIDPDVVGPGDLKQWVGAATFTVWYTRRAWVNDWLAAHQAAPKTLAGLANRLQISLGIPMAELDGLDEQLIAGVDIEPRLAQLSLDLDAFLRLIQIRKLVESGASVLASEWNDVLSILTNVQKRKEFAEWREFEKKENLILGPDLFKLQTPTTSTLSTKPLELPAWLASMEVRGRWLDTLEARIQQEQEIIDGLAQAVSATEEATLAGLRDALVLASNTSGTTLESHAKWVTDNLLIDASAGSCQQTMRIAQAIETVQGLLFGLRTAQLNDTYPLLDLDADDFEQEWKWIGSFANWRAAILVFLYPENQLSPSLRKWQTPVFAKHLVADLRATQRFTVEDACAVANRYAAYFRDVCSLSVHASCQALTRLHTGTNCQDTAATGYGNLVHLFGIGGETNTVYWSTYDPKAPPDYAQTFWDVVPGLEGVDVTAIVGAVPCQIAPDQRYIFLFALLQDIGKQKLVFTRYNLEKGEWRSEFTSLSLPAAFEAFDVVATQREKDEKPPELVINSGGYLYSRSLNEDGTGWESAKSSASPYEFATAQIADWEEFKNLSWSSLSVKTLHSVLDFGLYLLFYTNYDDKLSVLWGIEFDLGSGTPIGAVISSPGYVYVFYKNQGKAFQWLLKDAVAETTVVGLDRIARNFDIDPAGEKFIAYRRKSPQAGLYCAVVNDAGIDLNSQVRIGPNVSGPWDIPVKLAESKLQSKRLSIEQAFLNNALSPQSTLAYLEEAYYFVPLQIALQLQRSGDYTAALDCFRTVYDYSMPVKQRKIYYGLVLDGQKSSAEAYKREENWLLDPLNPHNIAATRRHAYTRYTMLCIVRCLLDYADAEFTRGTAESVPRARTLYLTALELLNTAPLKQFLSPCEQSLSTLDIEVGDAHQWGPVAAQIKLDLSNINSLVVLNSAIEGVKTAFSTDEPVEVRFAQASAVVANAKAQLGEPPTFGTLLEQSATTRAHVYTALGASLELDAGVQKVGATVARGFLHSVALVSGVPSGTLLEQAVPLPWLRATLPNSSNGSAPQNALSGRWSEYGALTAFNPIAPSHIATLVQLATDAPIQTLNIVNPYMGFYIPAPTFHFCIPANPELKSLRLRAEVNLYKLRHCRNIAGMECQLEPYAGPTTIQGTSFGSSAQRPTAYRYSVLIERTKQLVQLATQMEGAMLNALEAKDAANYTLLKARQDVQLAWADVSLQDLRRQQADISVTQATLQQDGAEKQVALYDEQEKAHKKNANAFAFSFEEFRQRDRARFDRDIAEQEITINKQLVLILQQEHTIAQMRAELAEAGVDFLANKFTNPELYDWMSGILEGFYSFYLRAATAMARLAANQLAFERQETIPAFIQADYWNVMSEAGGEAGTKESGVDRRGLTGSARLLRDITQLDLHAFATKVRKLNLTKTISLARLSPIDFQRFRETGLMIFPITLDMCDRDFPGHYLRLIQRVSVSVIALIPPVEGIRATLSTTGISRAVIGKDVFETVVINVDPQSVALSSPREVATGEVEMGQPSQMTLPFEGMGVDATWEFRMLKAANLIDYSTIADVLLTIEYTALESFVYRQQVVQRLNQNLMTRLERPFSFRHQFADQWYDLHNPTQTATPMSVKFMTRPEDFPQNLEAIRIQQVTLYFSSPTKPLPVPVPVQLRFREQGSSFAVGGAVTLIAGVGATNQGNAPSWSSIIGRTPVGEWELTLPDTSEVRALFRDKKIVDILFNLAISGRTAKWPVS